MHFVGYNVSNYLIGCVAFLTAAYVYGTWPYSYWRKRGIKGPQMYPFVGDLLSIVRHGFMKQTIDDINKYGRVHGTFLTRIPTLVVADIEMVRQVCIKQADKFTDRTKLGNQPSPLDRGITVLRGQEWRRVRNLMTPCFTSGRLRAMFPLIEDSARDLVAQLSRYIEQGNHDGAVFQPKKDFSNYTMDAIARTLFAIQINTHADPNNPFKVNAEMVFNVSLRSPKLILLLMMPKIVGPIYKFFNVNLLPQSCMDFFINSIRENLKIRRQSPDSSKFNDFLASCITAVDQTETIHDKQVKGLSEDEVVAQCFTFFLAGFETTANAMTFVAYLLALHPESQTRCFKEAQAAASSGKLDYEGVQELKYIGQCIDEALRLYPPVVFVDRMCNTTTTINGYEIEAGTSVRIPTHFLGTDPEVWGDDAAQFNPDRFSPEVAWVAILSTLYLSVLASATALVCGWRS
ncbi:hypothetical protein BOX15_Mlig034582g1 [Macrostomum lignano]|uniref:Cytochrome P450 n=1 Tax=Macrostomum lignano TaxID=282301 RepID=A0A267ECR9_9PLAT|nr:hypothetical protein BOX15_Mlig034582g1 [Macrostomum lignano]